MASALPSSLARCSAANTAVRGRESPGVAAIALPSDIPGENNYGSVVHEQNLKALEIIDKALEVTDSPKRRYFADSPDRFKFYMKDARRKVLGLNAQRFYRLA